MGINDRDYARREAQGATGPYVEPGVATRWLLGITVGVFVLQLLTFDPRSGSLGLTAFGQLDTVKVWHGEVWRLLTNGFLHSPLDIWHILGNLMVLWFAGKAIEERYGSKEFVAFYLTAILIGSLAYQFSHWNMPGFCLGASGGTTALFVLYACHWPNRTLLLFFVLPIPVWVAAMLFVMLDAMVFVNRMNTGVAVQVHLAGAAFACLYYRYTWQLTGWGRAFSEWRKQRSRPRLRVYREEEEEAAPIARLAASLSEEDQLEAKVDAVLEKLSQVGQENLSEAEKALLLRASEVFRKRRG